MSNDLIYDHIGEPKEHIMFADSLAAASKDADGDFINRSIPYHITDHGMSL